MSPPYAYTRRRDPQTGEVLLDGNVWERSPAPMSEVVAMTIRTQAGACAIDPGLGVDWRSIDRLGPGATATAQHAIEQALARYVAAGLIRAVSVTTGRQGSLITYNVTYIDPRMPATRQRINGAS